MLEDNQAATKVIEEGYSSKLTHVFRNHNVNIGIVYDTVAQNVSISVMYVNTNFQAADIFVKSLHPNKWGNALSAGHGYFPPSGRGTR